MKSGTSFLFEAIAQHPQVSHYWNNIDQTVQVVHALTGVVFKETGCYMTDNNRPNQYAYMLN